MVGRTHLQDATPMTLGQVDLAAGSRQLDARARRDPRDAAGALRAGARRHGGRHRAQRRRPVRRRWRSREIAEETGQPFVSAAEQVRGAVGARRDGAASAARCARWPARSMKIANDVRWYASRPAGRARRAAHPGERARLLDHARQDQPDPVRGADHGRRAGVRQRPGGRVRRLAGQLPAQRLQAGHARTTCSTSASCWPRRCRSFDEHCAAGIEPNLPSASASTSRTRSCW